MQVFQSTVVDSRPGSSESAAALVGRKRGAVKNRSASVPRSHELYSRGEHAPPRGLDVRVERRVELAHRLQKPVEPQVVELRLDVEVAAAVPPRQALEVDVAF